MKSALSEHPPDVLRLIDNLVEEFEVYQHYKERIRDELQRLGQSYQQEKFGYLDYQKKAAVVLQGRSEDDWEQYYNSTLYGILKQLEKVLAQFFYSVYRDERVPLSEPKPQPVPAPLQAAVPEKRAAAFEEKLSSLKQLLSGKRAADLPAAAEHHLVVDVPQVGDVRTEIERARAAARQQRKVPVAAEKETLVAQRQTPEAGKRKLPSILPYLTAFPLAAFHSVKKIVLKAAAIHVRLPRRAAKLKTAQKQPVRRSIFASLPSPLQLFRKTPFQPAMKQAKPKPAPLSAAKPSGFLAGFRQSITPRKRSIFVEEIVTMEKQARPEDKNPLRTGAGIAFGWFSVRGMVNEFLGKFRSKQEPVVGAETVIPAHFKKLREMRKRLYTEEKLSGFSSTLLAQEAKRVKKILEVERPTIYKGSSIGLIANVTVKRISLFLVDTFPEFFGFLYNSLRAANVKVLSNTYVNIMILVSILMTLFIGASLFVVFFALNYAIYEIFLRSILFAMLSGFATASIFYVYPFLKIKERRRKVASNLPFAINHLASVATSGVPPAKMFELIASSGEYSEVAVELKKIVDFTNVFGYDFLTAVRAVAGTTPSVPFKEFLEGLVSTVETGGDLDSFLRQKSEEATLTYQLERQRYNETVSTYSDIYTGVVIAAPLFFVASLALVNLLGGSIGGLGVDIVLALGAYVAIPFLNIAFLTFLQMNQPDV